VHAEWGQLDMVVGGLVVANHWLPLETKDKVLSDLLNLSKLPPPTLSPNSSNVKELHRWKTGNATSLMKTFV
jgi:hypothetical protein